MRRENKIVERYRLKDFRLGIGFGIFTFGWSGLGGGFSIVVFVRVLFLYRCGM